MLQPKPPFVESTLTIPNRMKCSQDVESVWPLIDEKTNNERIKMIFFNI